MKVNKEEKINCPFVLTGEEIEQIIKPFDNSDYFFFRATCADKTIREFTSVADLIGFENPLNKEIEFLGVNIFSKNHERIAHLSFLKGRFGSISIELAGEEKDVFLKMEVIKERLYGTSPWYAFISGINRSGMILGFLISWVFTFTLSSFIVRRLLTPDYSSVIYWGIFTAVVLACGLAFNFIWDRIMETFFPMGVFAIGQGKKRYKDAEIIRTTVIGGFVVSLLASIVVLLMS